MDKEYQYSLPSEAQWEYAARAGTTGDYAGRLDELAWYANNSGIKYWANEEEMKNSGSDWVTNKNGTREVGTKSPNDWGLYDMHGNVSEWCEDIYISKYDKSPIDGSAYLNSSETSRVIRGGSWQLFSEFLRAAFRNKYQPKDLGRYSQTFGFRVIATRKQ